MGEGSSDKLRCRHPDELLDDRLPPCTTGLQSISLRGLIRRTAAFAVPFGELLPVRRQLPSERASLRDRLIFGNENRKDRKGSAMRTRRASTRGRYTLAMVFACAATLLQAAEADAQYWSVGLSVGGGNTISAHLGMHLGNTEHRRASGLTGGRTEVELVFGLPRYELVDGSKRATPSIGLNLRQTARDSGLSVGVGLRISVPPNGATSGYQTVFHVPVGWEPYPLPARLFLLPGVGKRVMPSGDGEASTSWQGLIQLPMFQVYLIHTGGFHWT